MTAFAVYPLNAGITLVAYSSMERITCSWLKPPKLNMPTRLSGFAVAIISSTSYDPTAHNRGALTTTVASMLAIVGRPHLAIVISISS
ncbi:MAG: hypothetical protein HYW03_23670, partial [Deltaproteobacteria bacterium]|nr:hypothetical protein [Deltaproteobacteria bacterium]